MLQQKWKQQEYNTIQYNTMLQRVKVMGFVTMENELNSDRMHKPEEKLHAPSECLKVDHVIQRTLLPDMPKHRHANDGIYESYKGQQCTNIEESWQ
jgi:hypothetical protein